MKCPVSGAKSASVYPRDVNLTMIIFVHIAVETLVLSSIAFKNNGAPTLNLTNNVYKSKYNIKIHLLKQPSLFLVYSTSLNSFIVTYVSPNVYKSAVHHKCSAVGELPSKFTSSEKSYIWSWLCNINANMYCIVMYCQHVQHLSEN